MNASIAGKTLLGLAVLAAAGVALSSARVGAEGVRHWSQSRWSPAGLAPDPREVTEAVAQIYAARSWGWRGALAVHSWIAYKPAGAPSYTRWDVVGWGVSRGAPALRRNIRAPDGRWAGAEPMLLAELRGAEASRAIERIEAAIADYPYKDVYRAWPGPNSNTFTATIARAAPEFRLDLPSTAIGKDYLEVPLALTPSGDGVQLSLWGLAGLSLGIEDGVELSLFGLSWAIDPLDLAIELPGVGRIALADWTASAERATNAANAGGSSMTYVSP